MNSKNNLNGLIDMLNKKIEEANSIVNSSVVESNDFTSEHSEILGYINRLTHAKDILLSNTEDKTERSKSISTYAPDFNLNYEISEAIKEAHSYSGIAMEFSSNIIKELNEDSYIHSIKEQIESDYIRTYIHGQNMDRYMILHVVQQMLDSGAIKILFTEKADKKDINYLKKLCKDK